MIADLKPYPKYKESGQPWIGQVPEHWSQERAKWLFTKMARPAGESDDVVTCFRDGTVTLRKNRRLRGFTEAIYEFGYQGIRKGDLVIHAMDAFAGAVGVSDSDGKGTPVYAVCQPRPGANAHYFAFIVREMARSQWILALSRGIRERSTDFRYDTFGGQRVPLPPPDEQVAIVRFLDWANGRLERAIRAKRKVIALLNEQKQAIIHRAVTRGLDPSVPLKPSGIPWLGEIPRDWAGLQVRRVVSVVTSGSRGWANYYSDDGLIFLQSGNLGRSMSLNLSYIQHVRPPDGAEGERTRVRKNDVLICITGALTGNVAIVDQDLPDAAFVNQHVALVRPRPEMIEPRFLAYVLHSEIGRAQFKTNEYGGTKQGLGLGDVKSVFIPVPPPQQQRAICANLDAETAGSREALICLEREIGLLREYRTRLVADVVTGKLNVREAAEQLPAETATELAEDDAELSVDPEATEEEAAG